jgi:purine-nucleoside phosphorylase
MTSFYHSVMQSAQFLKSQIPNLAPDVGVLTGTGLSDTLRELEIIQTWPYQDLPNFPVSTVASHKGELVYGRLREKTVMMFQGRFHLYEGYTPQQAAFPVRLLQALSTPCLILSNAAGGINLTFSEGDIMVIEDHINLTGHNPLLGPAVPEWGLRFPDMTRVYDPDLRHLALNLAPAMDLALRQGVYAGLLGPSLETPAETRFLKTAGADAVGFSTVMEAVAGVQAGMKILGLSLITNINDPDAPALTTLEGVVDTAARASEKMSRLLSALIPKLDN